MKLASLAATCLTLTSLAWAAALWSGCASSTKNLPPAAALKPYAVEILQEGDVVQISFPGATNLNTLAKIPMDGIVKLQFAGEFIAVGKTPKQLEADIKEKFGPQLRLDEVLVTRISSSAAVYVSGAVLRPSKLPLERPLTVMEAIMEAGGFDQTRAKPNQVMVIRQEKGKQTTFTVDLKRALRGEETKPVYLQPSDVVHVPFKTFNL